MLAAVFPYLENHSPLLHAPFCEPVDNMISGHCFGPIQRTNMSVSRLPQLLLTFQGGSLLHVGAPVCFKCLPIFLNHIGRNHKPTCIEFGCCSHIDFDVWEGAHRPEYQRPASQVSPRIHAAQEITLSQDRRSHDLVFLSL